MLWSHRRSDVSAALASLMPPVEPRAGLRQGHGLRIDTNLIPGRLVERSARGIHMLLRLAATALATTALIGTSLVVGATAGRDTTGAPGAGDPYFPRYGNGHFREF